jgi:hypothetical protein
MLEFIPMAEYNDKRSSARRNPSLKLDLGTKNSPSIKTEKFGGHFGTPNQKKWIIFQNSFLEGSKSLAGTGKKVAQA